VKLNYPYTPGWEGSGTVVKAGPNSDAQTEALVGKRIAFMKANEASEYKWGGSFAEYLVSDTPNCIPISDDFSFE